MRKLSTMNKLAKKKRRIAEKYLDQLCLEDQSDNLILSRFQKDMFEIYNTSDAELESVLGQTYRVRGAIYHSNGSCHAGNEKYACIVKVSTEECWQFGNKKYNELHLYYTYFAKKDQIGLVLASQDDTMWYVNFPHRGHNLLDMWQYVLECLNAITADDPLTLNYALFLDLGNRLVSKYGTT